MVQLEDWQARLVLRIMNTVAPHYSETVRKSEVIMKDIEFLRERLEAQVGTCNTSLD